MTKNELISIYNVYKKINIMQIPKHCQLNFLRISMDGKFFHEKRMKEFEEVRNKVLTGLNINEEDLQGRIEKNKLTHEDRVAINEIEELVLNLINVYGEELYENKYKIAYDDIVDICKNTSISVPDSIILMKMAE